MLRKSASPRRRVAAILLLALASTGAASASSAAAPAPTPPSLQLSLAGAPQPGGLGAVTSMGSAASPGTVVIYLDRGSSCADTTALEDMRLGTGQVLPLPTHTVTAAGPFGPFTSQFPAPAHGSYLLCGYLTDGTPTPAAVAPTPLVIPVPGGP
ncbi:MAG: hypothetical protein ACR2ND_02415, partial [Solirubrobacteraceae bacterium]